MCIRDRDKTKEDVEAIHKCEEDESMKEQYSSEDAKKDLTIVYAQTGVKFPNITTGKQIRHLRTQLGMTQEELAGELNVTRQALSNWEPCCQSRR